LISAIDRLKTDQAEIEIEETGEKIITPGKSIETFKWNLKSDERGKTCFNSGLWLRKWPHRKRQNCWDVHGRHLVKLLEEGKIEYTKIGKHRRIKYEDIVRYKQQMKEDQKKYLVEIMNADEELGLYDS